MDFRALKAVVEEEEHFLDESSHLPVNKINGAYDNLDEYLDTHFRLVREDLLTPYRQAVKELRKRKELDFRSQQVADTQIYNKVVMIGMRPHNAGMEYVLKFDNVQGHSMFVDWVNAKLLMFNSLLCISRDGYETFFWAVVSTRRARELSEERMIGVRGVDRLEANFEWGVEYTMFESTSAYFEAYHHVLKVLQRKEMDNIKFLSHFVFLESEVGPPGYVEKGRGGLTGGDGRNLAGSGWKEDPMICAANGGMNTGWGGEARDSGNAADDPMDTDLGGETEDLGVDGCEGELESVAKRGCDGGDENFVLGNKDDRNKGRECDQHSQADENMFLGFYSDIDYSQKAAIMHGLSKKLAIIQGPAGTGKTFVGLFITEQLLADPNVCGPIVVVCYTNRALDQFLEGIYKYEGSLVRLGTGSKSQVLQDCSLERFQKKLRIQLPRDLRSEKGRLRSIKEEMAAKLNFGVRCMYAERVTMEALDRVANEEHMDSLFFCDYCRSDDTYQSWLAGNNKVHPNPNCPNKSAIENSIKRQSLGIQEIDDKIDPISVGLLFEYSRINDVWILDTPSRKSLDQHWLDQIKLHGQKEFWNLAPAYEDICNQLAKTQSKIQQYILRSAKILGMTTTVAARYFDVLYAIKPQVMIVEEAAEVLEGQLLACLNPHIDHLILIGDHMQLRPLVAASQLAFDYQLDVSLFERLVTNGIEYKTLEVQRRMRPAIAYLLLGFYPTLKDHRCVKTLDKVKGVHHNVFFLDHTNVESCVDNSNSKVNIGEADLVVEFAMYLINKCGYSSEDITILSMYRSQADEISQRLMQHFPWKRMDQDDTHNGEAPRVRSVDEFQGEESNIVILSLVRNTTQSQEFLLSDQTTESIGFLGTPNRICVALSRAKLGLYMFGNASLLSEKSEIWDDIIARLSRNGWTGSRMRLCCPNHSDMEFRVRTSNEFSSLSCPHKCNVTLKCGHKCLQNCHVGGHANMSCPNKCGRLLEQCGHVCMKMCHSNTIGGCYPCNQCNHFWQ